MRRRARAGSSPAGRANLLSLRELRLASHVGSHSSLSKPASCRLFSAATDKRRTIRRVSLLSDRFQLASALPYPGYRFPELLAQGAAGVSEGACRLLADGIDIRTIQLMRGHAGIKRT